MISACKKNSDSAPINQEYSENEAVITGYDFTQCACCGGYVVSIVNNPPYGQDFLAMELPGNMDVQPSGSYPIYVKMKWKVDSNACDTRYIHIISMEKK